jgi:chlorobactene glucosyltransferase
MSILVDSLLLLQSLLVFLLAGYEYLTLMHFPVLPYAPGDSSPEKPLVSIILPIRNQAGTVEGCLETLTHLDYPRKEIIVVEGGSTDGTQQILEKYRGKIQLIQEDPLPEGWVGKNWACHLGYQKAQGKLLLFTDGDSVHSHDSLTRMVDYLQTTDSSFVSLAPKPILKTFWEKLMQPPIFLLIMLFVGGKWVNDDKKVNALGNGQYMLLRREAYEKLGGHQAVKNKIVEDYSLARLAKKDGLRLRVVNAPDAVGVRMYSSLGEIWRGWRKNFYTIAGSRASIRSILRLLLIFDLFVLPYIILGWGIFLAFAMPLNIFLATGVFMVTLLWLGIIVLDRSVGVGLGYALLLPLAILVYIGIGIDSTIRGIFGLGFTWKGRVYGREVAQQVPAQIA